MKEVVVEDDRVCDDDLDAKYRDSGSIFISDSAFPDIEIWLQCDRVSLYHHEDLMQLRVFWDLHVTTLV